jgi:acyl-CoA reductase-like NAD-dependent aldehyde dehydrogenase
MSQTTKTPVRPAGLNYVAGEWRPSESGATYEKRNPMHPEDVAATAPASTAADVDAAIGAAAAAFPSWAALPAARRAEYLAAAADALEARAEEAARDMTAELGKPLRESRGEVLRAAESLRFFAAQGFQPIGEVYEHTTGPGRIVVSRRPLGVVGLITPWNYPAALPVFKSAPALVYGNTVVLKLAYEAPQSGLHVAAAFAEAGLPAGALNVVTGRGSVVGEALLSDPRVQAISFTGSVETGYHVRDEATKHGKRVQLELGGQNPLIVLADADIDRAVEAAWAGAYPGGGQRCTATRRIFVEDAVYGEFRDKLVERIGRTTIGDPTDPDIELGPLASEAQCNDVLVAIARGVSEGGTVIAGGRRLHDEAFIVAPTLFEGVGDDSYLSREEVFGPVASLYRCRDIDDALARANDVAFGLSASIYTSSLASAQRFQNEAEAGTLHVNSQTSGADVHVPFGGIKSSGFGPHEQGTAAREFFTNSITTYIDL